MIHNFCNILKGTVLSDMLSSLTGDLLPLYFSAWKENIFWIEQGPFRFYKNFWENLISQPLWFHRRA